MNKESIIEFQKLNCNCNDCIFMVRDMEKFKESLERHHKWQLDYFNVCKQKVIEKAKQVKNVYYDLETWDDLLTKAENMKFQFDKAECKINFGRCTKFDKEVTFIPGDCQIETQQCFKHRKDAN